MFDPTMFMPLIGETLKPSNEIEKMECISHRKVLRNGVAVIPVLRKILGYREFISTRKGSCSEVHPSNQIKKRNSVRPTSITDVPMHETRSHTPDHEHCQLDIWQTPVRRIIRGVEVDENKIKELAFSEGMLTTEP